VYEFAARMLVRAGRGQELHQLSVQYAVQSDSVGCVAALQSETGSGQEQDALWQVAADALKRLGEWEALLDMLLARGLVVQACELALARPALLGRDEGAGLLAAAAGLGPEPFRLAAFVLQSLSPAVLRGPPPSRLAQRLGGEMFMVKGSTRAEAEEFQRDLGFA
jgi:hypothetical protein